MPSDRRTNKNLNLILGSLQIKMLVLRNEPSHTTEFEVDISKKAGKEIGLGFAEIKDYGLTVTEIVSFDWHF